MFVCVLCVSVVGFVFLAFLQHDTNLTDHTTGACLPALFLTLSPCLPAHTSNYGRLFVARAVDIVDDRASQTAAAGGLLVTLDTSSII